MSKMDLIKYKIALKQNQIEMDKLKFCEFCGYRTKEYVKICSNCGEMINHDKKKNDLIDRLGEIAKKYLNTLSV